MKNFWFLDFILAFIFGGIFMTAIILYNEPVYIEAEVVAQNETHSFFSDGVNIYTYENPNIKNDVPYLIQAENGKVLIAWEPA